MFTFAEGIVYMPGWHTDDEEILYLVPTARLLTFNLRGLSYQRILYLCCQPKAFQAQGLYWLQHFDDNLEELKARNEISPVSSNQFTTSASTINQRLSLAARRDLFHNRSVTNYRRV